MCTVRVWYKYDDGTVLGEFAGVTARDDGDHEALQTRGRVRSARVQNKKKKPKKGVIFFPPTHTPPTHPDVAAV